MQELELLNDKLDQLIKKYATLQAENKKLQTTISSQLQSIDGLNKKLVTLEQNMNTVSMGNAFAGTEDKEKMRKHRSDGISILITVSVVMAVNKNKLHLNLPTSCVSPRHCKSVKSSSSSPSSGDAQERVG